MHESVLKRADADICEKRETLDATLIRRVLGHHHTALTDCLTPDPTKVGGRLYLGVSQTIPTIEKLQVEIKWASAESETT
jgi:hypothetical protein